MAILVHHTELILKSKVFNVSQRFPNTGWIEVNVLTHEEHLSNCTLGSLSPLDFISLDKLDKLGGLIN